MISRCITAPCPDLCCNRAKVALTKQPAEAGMHPRVRSAGNLLRRPQRSAARVLDRLELRQAVLLQPVLRTCIVGVILAFPLILYATLLLEPRGSSGLTAGAGTILCLGSALALIRRRFFQHALRLATMGLVCTISVPLGHTGLVGGGMLVFAFAIPLLLAGLLADRRLLLVTTGLILMIVESIGVLEWRSAVRMPFAYPLLLLGFAAMLFLVSALLLQFGASFRGAMRELLIQERDIEETYALMEQTVADRTASLDVVNRGLQQANAELVELSFRDALTGVANRRQFDTTLDAEWRRAVRSGTPLSLLLLDIDDFKRYNDTYGHLAGDTCLQQVAGFLQRRVRRSGDLVARYGGEEFVVLLPGSEQQSALALAGSLIQGIRELALPHRTSRAAPVVTVSVGIATIVPEVGQSAESLIAAADTALYVAKERGRNGWASIPRVE